MRLAESRNYQSINNHFIPVLLSHFTCSFDEVSSTIRHISPREYFLLATEESMGRCSSESNSQMLWNPEGDGEENNRIEKREGESLLELKV